MHSVNSSHHVLGAYVVEFSDFCHIKRITLEWWGTGMVISLERGANDLHMVQLMPLPPHHLLLH